MTTKPSINVKTVNQTCPTIDENHKFIATGYRFQQPQSPPT